MQETKTRTRTNTADLNSPQYLTLQEMIDDVIEIIQNSIPVVAPKLQAHDLVQEADRQEAINSVFAGRNNAVIAQKLMQPVQLRVKYVPNSFYNLVDALNASSLNVPIGEMLEKRCSELQDSPVKSTAMPILFFSHPQRQREGLGNSKVGWWVCWYSWVVVSLCSNWSIIIITDWCGRRSCKL